MFILRLYVLDGCPSCQQAINFISSKRLPAEIIVANNDPIILAGNKAMNNGEDKYPILLCNMTKDLIVGFKEDAYVRICESAGALFGNSGWNISNSEQQPNGQNPTPPSEAIAGTN